jgi:hypothetical protein
MPVLSYASEKTRKAIGHLSDFVSSSGFRERSCHLILHTPGVGTYVEVIYSGGHLLRNIYSAAGLAYIAISIRLSH